MSGPRILRDERGQSLVLSALTLLVVSVAVLLTFAIGHRVREKTKLQATADAAAYTLGVAEARALNYYAFSNRAMVAQMVSMLSVQAHQSYVTFYGDAIFGLANDLELVGKNYDGQAKSPARSGSCRACIKQLATAYHSAARVAYMESFSPPVHNPADTPYKNLGPWMSAKSPSGFGGAMWFRDTWVFKYATLSTRENYCGDFITGMFDHWRNHVKVISSQQSDIQQELSWYLLGRDPSTGGQIRRHLITPAYAGLNTPPDEDQPDSYVEGAVTGTFPKSQPLADKLARQIDPKLKAALEPGQMTWAAYQRAVRFRPKQHLDWDEVLYGTRYPDFVTAGLPVKGSKWNQLMARIKGVLNPMQARWIADLQVYGTAAAVGSYRASTDPGATQNSDARGLVTIQGNLVKHVHPSTDNDFLVESRASKMLAKSIYDTYRHTRAWGNELGNSQGLGAEAHGTVFVAAAGSRCGCEGPTGHATRIDNGRDAVYSSSETYGGSSEKGFHAFMGVTPYMPGHGLDPVDANHDGRISQAERNFGGYPGHMQFVTQAGTGYPFKNQPHVFSAIYRDAINRSDTGRPFPWDFNFRISLGGAPFKFTTLSSTADAQTGARMTAESSALVYFHKPERDNAAGEGWKEPPTLWNPYWRVKLNGLRAVDVQNATRTASPATSALAGKGGQWLVNY